MQYILSASNAYTVRTKHFETAFTVDLTLQTDETTILATLLF